MPIQEPEDQERLQEAVRRRNETVGRDRAQRNTRNQPSFTKSTSRGIPTVLFVILSILGIIGCVMTGLISLFSAVSIQKKRVKKMGARYKQYCYKCQKRTVHSWNGSKDVCEDRKHQGA